MAGFEKNSNVIRDLGRGIVGGLVNVFMPYVNLYEYLLYGENAKYTGITGLAQVDAQVLFIHSENDAIVNYEENFLAYQKAFGTDERMSFLSLPANGHNAFLSPTAGARIEELDAALETLDPDSDAYEEAMHESYQLTLQLDEFVVDAVLDFYNQVLAE